MTEQPSASWHGVEFRHLAALEAVAREQSFSAAADLLGYTQSAISAQITALERIVDARLFVRVRGSRGVELTEEGRLLLEHASAIAAHLHAARADLHATRHGLAGVTRVGTFQTVSQSLLPEILRGLGGEPRTTLYEDALIERLVLKLEQGELDVSFVLLPLAAPQLETVELVRDPWHLLVRRDHPFAERTAVAVTELADVPLLSLERLLPAGSPSKAPRSIHLVEDAIVASGVIPQIALRLNDYRSVRVMVEAGLGCGLVPSLAVQVLEEGLVAVPVEPGLQPRIVGLAWHRDRRETRSISRFVEVAYAEAQRRRS